MHTALAHVESGELGAVEAAALAMATSVGPATAGAVTCRAAARVDFGVDGEVVVEEEVGSSSSSSGGEAATAAVAVEAAAEAERLALFAVPAAHYQRAALEQQAAAAAEAAAVGAAAAPSGGEEAATPNPISPPVVVPAASLAPSPRPDPRSAMDAAHRLVRVPGSATAVLAQLDAASGKLCTANLGDSGLMVLRRGGGGGGGAAAGAAAAGTASAAASAASVVFRSRPLQHFFDCPLQLGACPEFVDATDGADQAECRDVPVLPGDVIVMGSDGLWDNMFDGEVAEVVARSFFDVPAGVLQPDPAGGGSGGEEGAAAAMVVEGGAVASSSSSSSSTITIPPDARLAPALAASKLCAERLARQARRHAADERRDSPYAAEARAQGLDLPWWEKVVGTRFTAGGKVEVGKLTGGKMDDVTVLVAQVVAAA
jgi:hypothetical protein